MYDISPHARTTASILIFLYPKFEPQAKTPIQLDVIVTDQFGNEHIIKKVSFRSS
jgi:hypothetical protein